jgi:hypothetical protein
MFDKITTFFKSERVKKHLPKVLIILLCIAATIIFFTGNMLLIYCDPKKVDTLTTYDVNILSGFLSIAFLPFIVAVIIFLFIEKKLNKNISLVIFIFISLSFFIFILNLISEPIKQRLYFALKIEPHFEYILLLIISIVILILFFIFYVLKKPKVNKLKPKYSLSLEIENLSRLHDEGKINDDEYQSAKDKLLK